MSQNTNLHLRLLTPEDYHAMITLWKICQGVGIRPLDDSEEGIRRYLSRNPATCFGAELDGDLIGTIFAGHDGRRGYIYHLAVADRARRQGIAARLVDTALDALKEEGIHKVGLIVFENNQGGNAFWEQMGFHRRTDIIYRDRNLTPGNE